MMIRILLITVSRSYLFIELCLFSILNFTLAELFIMQMLVPRLKIKFYVNVIFYTHLRTGWMKEKLSLK